MNFLGTTSKRPIIPYNNCTRITCYLKIVNFVIFSYHGHLRSFVEKVGDDCFFGSEVHSLLISFSKEKMKVKKLSNLILLDICATLKKVILKSYILSYFDYCPLIWFVSSAKSLKKVENLQKRAFRFLQNDYHSSYETLLGKSGKTTVNERNLRNLFKEIFVSLNNPNPVFLKEVFHFKESNRLVREKYKLKKKSSNP